MMETMNEIMNPVRDTSRYQRGKIYKMVNSVDDSIYVGSTCLALSSRFYTHKKHAKHKPLPCHKHFNTIGWDNVRIVLIENVVAENRDQLIKREQYYIDLLKPSLNKHAAFVHCPHGKKHCECKECGGASICSHNRLKSQCKECGGVSICSHNRHKPQCRDCGGASICPHNREKSHCRDCNGDEYHCYECDKSLCGKSELKDHNRSKKHITTYRKMFLEAFGEDITDEEIIRVSTV
jgi:hypothetical protein